MKTKFEAAMTQYIYEAKIVIESRNTDLVNPVWSYCRTRDAHNDSSRVELYVLEGTVPRGMIIANYALGVVEVLDHEMCLITTLRAEDSAFIKYPL